MNVFRRLRDWVKYDPLSYHPALKQFDRDEAMQRLKAYNREEREAMQPWLTIGIVTILAFYAAFITASFWERFLIHLGTLLQIPLLGSQFYMHRRVRKRVGQRVAEELGEGRVWRCLECGYDLRASAERCPECGRPVRMGRPDLAGEPC